MNLYERNFFDNYNFGEGFYLVSDNWNDYGYHTLFYLYYFDGTNENMIGGVKIGNRNNDFRTKIGNLINGENQDFFSLGCNKEYYSNIYNLDDDKKKFILNRLNDIAYNLELFEEIKNYEITKTSLLRGIYSKTVQDQFHRIIKGDSELTKYEFEFKKDDILINFKVDPESKPQSNMHGIIGSNGVGKTKLLQDILSNFLDPTKNNIIDKTGNNNPQDLFANALFISYSVFDTINIEEDKKFNYIGVQKLDNKNSNKNQDELTESFINSIEEIRASKDSSAEIWNRSIEVLKMSDTISTIKTLSFNNNVEDEKIKEELKKEFNKLSSGQKIVLVNISKMVEKVSEKTLILLDEPEMYLHPPLLASYMKVISLILNKKNGVAIIATHSPIVMQELGRDNINIIKKDENKRVITKPRIETYGENVGTLTREVFRLEIENTGYYKELRESVHKYRNYDDIIEVFQDSLGIEARAILRILLKSEDLTND
ncbi:AAA family ATPase [Staphylococcus epidermidis]|uniref:AAA family ATPase n=1 Tax=Staphylococcus epidermidis TaxID=1282 RepID=UPI002739457C|nr:AAA family ATPase [Staphylococcus epidermidis]MCG2218635.1 ATP-binding protein [Staphylococcus epidermidis]